MFVALHFHVVVTATMLTQSLKMQHFSKKGKVFSACHIIIIIIIVVVVVVVRLDNLIKILPFLNVTFCNLIDISDVSGEPAVPIHMSDVEGSCPICTSAGIYQTTRCHILE